MSSAIVILIKESPLIWLLSMLPSIRWVSRRLRLPVQQVAFYFYILKIYPVRVYTPVTETSPMCDDPPQDRRGAVSFCHRDIAETPVFMCEQMPYPKFFVLA